MTVKKFFKSTAFKCIITLLAILLICGVFLTIADGFLHVSEEEKFNRIVKKIYGKEVDCEEVDISDAKTAFDYSTVTKAYLVKNDGNYLIQAEGKEGFGGTVTCWVVVKVGKGDDGTTETVIGVEKVAIDKASGESYINRISQGALDELAAKAEYGKELEGGFKHGSQEKGDDFIATGASCSMRAISNCINGAMQFTAAYISGIKPEDFYGDNGFKYLELINKSSTSYSAENGVVTYKIKTTGSGPVSSFEITVVVGKADETISITSVAVDLSGSVSGKGKDKEEYDTLTKTNYTGKTLDYFTEMLGEDMEYPGDNADKDISTGASRSSYNVAYACAFALANYEKAIATPYNGGNE